MASREVKAGRAKLRPASKTPHPTRTVHRKSTKFAATGGIIADSVRRSIVVTGDGNQIQISSRTPSRPVPKCDRRKAKELPVVGGGIGGLAMGVKRCRRHP
jgi:hypothetical protein